MLDKVKDISFRNRVINMRKDESLRVELNRRVRKRGGTMSVLTIEQTDAIYNWVGPSCKRWLETENENDTWSSKTCGNRLNLVTELIQYSLLWLGADTRELYRFFHQDGTTHLDCLHDHARTGFGVLTLGEAPGSFLVLGKDSDGHPIEAHVFADEFVGGDEQDGAKKSGVSGESEILKIDKAKLRESEILKRLTVRMAAMDIVLLQNKCKDGKVSWYAPMLDRMRRVRGKMSHVAEAVKSQLPQMTVIHLEKDADKAFTDCLTGIYNVNKSNLSTHEKVVKGEIDAIVEEEREKKRRSRVIVLNHFMVDPLCLKLWVGSKHVVVIGDAWFLDALVRSMEEDGNKCTLEKLKKMKSLTTTFFKDHHVKVDVFRKYLREKCWFSFYGMLDSLNGTISKNL